MGFTLTPQNFDDALAALSASHRIIAPVRQKGQGAFSDTDVIGYGEVSKFEQIVWKEKTYFSPKEHLFPIREPLFYFQNGTPATPELSDDRPIIIFLRPCDINGIHRLDRIFLENGQEKDFYYARRRKQTSFFMLECREGFDSCFCASMNADKTDDYACAFRFKDNEIQVEVKDSKFQDYFSAGTANDFTPLFDEKDQQKVTIPPIETTASEEIFEHDLWKAYTSRCIACGRCNTSCVTCSCFTVQDVSFDRNNTCAERHRVWAGCHLDGFTDMAGGHTFRKKHGDRMRFKTMHKINDFYRRFGEHQCVGCGRCNDVCPEYISFSECINKLNKIVQEQSNDS
jgi:anaerobic sulfite reductase subunit A